MHGLAFGWNSRNVAFYEVVRAHDPLHARGLVGALWNREEPSKTIEKIVLNKISGVESNSMRNDLTGFVGAGHSLFFPGSTSKKTAHKFHKNI